MLFPCFLVNFDAYSLYGRQQFQDWRGTIKYPKVATFQIGLELSYVLLFFYCHNEVLTIIRSSTACGSAASSKHMVNSYGFLAYGLHLANRLCKMMFLLGLLNYNKSTLFTIVWPRISSVHLLNDVPESLDEASSSSSVFHNTNQPAAVCYYELQTSFGFHLFGTTS